jgi:hypothetical protein
LENFEITEEEEEDKLEEEEVLLEGDDIEGRFGGISEGER